MKMLLESKFFQPRPRQEILVRPRLLEQLNAGLERKLILVLAQAGFGKSTLVAQWLNTLIQEKTTSPAAISTQNHYQGHYQGRNRVAWLSLDENDNDPLRFFDYLITALQRADSSIGQHARFLLSGPQPPSSLESLVISLINDLTNLSGHLVLALDDYHTITSQEVHRAIHYFVNHAPEFFHLMIVSRMEPPLPLTRWRMYRELSEIRENDLRFTLDEATTYLLDTMNCALSSAEVAALEQRTEGWIVGLHLAALTLHSRSDSAAFITEFAGSHAYIVDYLTEEVLQRQPSEIQEFLFQTSLLSRFSGPLCDAVMGHTGSQKTLEHLERSHLFIIPLDNERGWYRYHHLFAEMLRRRAQEHPLRHGAEIYRRATQWYIEKGLVMEAIEYALAAENGNYAAELIERSLAPLAARGQFVTLLQWLTRLPHQTLLSHPMLCATRTRIALRQHELDEAEKWLQLTWDALAAQIDQDPKIVGEAHAMQVDLTLNRGRLAETIRLGNEALAILPEDLHLSRGEILLFLGIAYYWDDQYAKSTEITALAAYHATRAGDTLTALYALVNQARFTQTQGKLRAALAMFDKTWAYAVSQNIDQLPLMGTYHNNRGEVLYEWNMLEEAEKFFLKGIYLSEQMNNPRSRLRSYSLLLPIYLARGDKGKADEMLRLALDLMQHVQLPNNILDECHRTIVQKWLADGDLEAVAEWIQRRALPLTLPPKGGLEYEHLLVARYYVAKGDLKAAAALLEPATLSARTLGKGTTSIALQSFYALVLQQLGDGEAAFHMIKQTLEMTAPEGFVRTFLDEGKAMQALLATSQPRLSQKLQGYANLLLQTFDQPTSHVRPQPVIAPRNKLPDDPHLSESIEPLSDREIEVLRLVADGLSDSQIAAKLVLATGTVKRHLNNIYGKLGVHNRTHALARARAHNIL